MKETWIIWDHLVIDTRTCAIYLEMCICTLRKSSYCHHWKHK